jgi:hypothetical protein
MYSIYTGRTYLVATKINVADFIILVYMNLFSNADDHIFLVATTYVAINVVD